MLSIENDLDVINLSDDENITELTDNNELEVAIYTCTASGILPSFNSGFTYTYDEIDNGDGTYTTKIYTDSLDNLPSTINFSEKTSLLKVHKLNISNLTSFNTLFFNCRNLIAVECAKDWDTSNIMKFDSAFYQCSKLAELDVSNWNVYNVTSFWRAFYGCATLTELDISKWNTRSATNLDSIFRNCNGLTSLDLSNWDTSKVNSMQSMFFGCSGLTSLDLSNFDTSKVTNMGEMFNGCSRLTSLDLSNWDTSKVTNMSSLFYNCTTLKTITGIENWDISSCNNFASTFRGVGLTSLDLTNWSPSAKSINMSNMFRDCKSLTSIIVPNLINTNVIAIGYLFGSCELLTTINMANWNTGNITVMEYMFQSCKALTSLDLSNWNTSSVTNISGMFANCTSLKTLHLLGWSPAEVERVVVILPTVTPTGTVYGSLLIDETLLPSGWVYDSELEVAIYTCTASGILPSFNSGFTYTHNEVDNGDGTYTTTIIADSLDNLPTQISFDNQQTLLRVDKLNTSQVTNMVNMFSGCRNLEYVNFENCDTSKVTTTYGMFYYCSKLTELDLSNFDTSQVTNMQSMFSRCSSLTSLDLSNFNTSQVTNMTGMFYNCRALTTLDISNFDMGKVTNMTGMFSVASVLISITCNNLNTIIALSGELPTRTSDSQGEIVTEVHRKMSETLKATLSSKHWTVTELPYVVLKYKFNHKLYADLLPALNSSFNDYTILDEVNNKDGVTIRSIKSLSPPTSIRFGTASNTIQDQQKCLLEVLDLDTSEVTNMNNMFSYCTNLISVSSDWNTGKASDMSRMFCNCPSLASLDVSNFDTSKATTMAYMFWGCSSLDMIDVSSWDVGKVSNMQSMFESCSLISELDVSDWNVGSLTNMAYMLQNCSSLSKLNVANWKPNNVININNMFNNCKSLTTLDASNWNISKATSFASLFAGCTSLVRVNLSNWNTSSVTSLGGTFSGCTSLVEADLSNWNTSKNTNMATMFYNCTSLESIIGLDGFDTRSVSNMKNVFQNCQSLTTLDLSNFDTTNGNCSEIFRDCRNLSKIGMLYCNKKTVNDLITQIKSINTSLKKEIYLIDVEPSEMEVINNITYHKGVNHEEEILLPCQLMKVGDIRDRLYYDKDSGKYFIEKNIISETLNGKEHYSMYDLKDEYPDVAGFYCHLNHKGKRDSLVICDKFKTHDSDFAGYVNTNLEVIAKFGDTINYGTYAKFTILRNKLSSLDGSGFAEWMSNNPTTVYYPLNTPTILETKVLNKIIIPSSDENNLSTISVKSNDHIGATDINLRTNSIRYNPLGLSTNTLYTLQLDSIPSNVKTISANLGGTVKNIDMSTNNHCSIEITTPSTLTTDNLELIGEGIKVSNVMLFNGKPNQNPEYVDGIQSIGELQENGKYKIDIQTKTDVLYEEEYEMTDKLVIEDTKDIGHVRVDKIVGNSFGDITDTGYSNSLSVGARVDINSRYWFRGIRFKESKLNDKIYVKLNVTLHEINTTSITPEICTRFSGGFNGTNIPLTSLPVGTPTQVSMYRRHDYDFTSTNGNYLMFGVVMNSEIPDDVPSGKSVAALTINNYVAYNLTEMFGSGNEPTQEWCDENLPYIEGLKSTFEEGLVTQEQVDNRQELEENLDKYKANVGVSSYNIVLNEKDLVELYNSMGYVNVKAELTKDGKFKMVGNGLWGNPTKVFKLKPNTRYTALASVSYANTNYYHGLHNTKMDSERKCCSFTTDDTGVFGLLLRWDSGTETNFVIVEGEVDSYDLYAPLTTQSIYLNSPLLRGDEIVMKDGELCHYHKMGKVTLNGSENWGVHIQGTNCYSLSFTGASSSQSNALSNRMKVSTSYKTDSDSLVIEATRIIYTETKAGISPTEANYLKVPKLKEYLQENPLVIIYELAEPYYEPLNQNQINIDTPETRFYVSIDSLIPPQNANVTYLEYGICNNSIELDEPLRAIGNVRDKLYWDWYEGKYVLERNIGKIILDGSENWGSKWSDVNDSKHFFLFNQSHIKNSTSGYCDTLKVLADNLEYNKTEVKAICKIGDWGSNPIVVRFPKSELSTSDVEGFKEWLYNNPTTFIYELSTPTKEYISLPKQNTKTYAPVTYLTMPNIPLKTDISIDTDIQKYRPNYLSANTKYTVFLDSVGDNDIKVELGGKVETITPSMEHGQNKVIITTPSTLSHNDLYVSGAGNKVKNVMLMQNEITQSPEYIDSIQSVGENVENEHLGTLVNLGEGNKYKNIFINEIHGDTYKGSSLGELIVDEFGDPVLDDNGDKQYTFKIKISNHPFGKGGRI